MPDFRSIEEIFNTDTALTNVRNFIKQADVVLMFPKIFPDIKKFVDAVKLEKQVLFLRVENSVWRSELKFRQKLIIERINNHCGDNVVKSIKFIA
ncbi:MAG: DUF721 domain-containing protein [Ignavibacteriales bacterium]|nr:MAG: DUF721 domain-containing protein [Ignavibacteriales bacterium]